MHTGLKFQSAPTSSWGQGHVERKKKIYFFQEKLRVLYISLGAWCGMLTRSVHFISFHLISLEL